MPATYLPYFKKETPMPHFEGISLTPPAKATTPGRMIPQLTGESSRSISVQQSGAGSFSISSDETDRYYAAWNTCSPNGGFVTGFLFWFLFHVFFNKFSRKTLAHDDILQEKLPVNYFSSLTFP